MKYPKEFNKLINFFKSLPGIGEKNAERLAFCTLEMEEKKLDEFGNVLLNIKDSIKKCSVCGNISDGDKCLICSDSSRNERLICVVEDYKNLYSFENSSSFNGTYHILGGLISPMDNINPDDLNIHSLLKRVRELDNCEVILALTSSIEGEMTMLYLKKCLSEFDVKVTRLSYGVPLGMNLKYMDVLSLNKALEDRREIED